MQSSHLSIKSLCQKIRTKMKYFYEQIFSLTSGVRTAYIVTSHTELQFLFSLSHFQYVNFLEIHSSKGLTSETERIYWTSFKHSWWYKTKSMLFSWIKIPCYSQLNKRKYHFKRKIIRTFKGINFQWVQEHLIHINVLEVNAFRSTAQGVGKRVSIYKMVPI